jgi:autotransporter-associated beta strand protein
MSKYTLDHPPRFAIGRTCAAVLAGLLVAAPHSSEAASFFWDPQGIKGTGSGGAGIWDTSATNKVWASGGVDVAWADNNTAVFQGPGDAVAVNSAVTAAGITFSSGGYTLTGASTITLAASLIMNATGGSTVEIDNPVNVTTAQSWSVAAANSMQITGNVSTSNGTGAVTVTGAGTMFIFSGSFTVSKFTVNGGATVNWGGSATLPGGANSFTGFGDTTAGTFNMNTGDFTTAAAVFIGNNTTGTVTINDGPFAMTGNQPLSIGDGTNNNQNGTGVLNIAGTGRFTTGTTTGNFFLGNLGTGSGTINLNGGTLATNRTITRGSFNSGGAGTGGVFNFNGGVLQATGSSLAMTGLTRANIRNGGAIIDTNGFNVTIAQQLVHSNIGGDNNPDGGFTKTGDGILSLSAANQWTGLTNVQAGTLLVNGTLAGTSRVDVAGTLGGSGTITTATGSLAKVVLASGSGLSPGNGGTGTLTIQLSSGTLDLTDALGIGNTGELAFELGLAGDKVVLTGGQLVIGAGNLEFDDFTFTNLAGFNPATTYTLFDGTLATNGTLGPGTSGSIAGFPFVLQLINGNADLVLMPVPEPASAVLMLGGLGTLLARRRQRRR